MSKSKDKRQFSLFDEPEPIEPTIWREVHQDTFFAWNEKQQLLYCANRDLNAATDPEFIDMKEFFQERAKSYITMATSL